MFSKTGTRFLETVSQFDQRLANPCARSNYEKWKSFATTVSSSGISANRCDWRRFPVSPQMLVLRPTRSPPAPPFYFLWITISNRRSRFASAFGWFESLIVAILVSRTTNLCKSNYANLGVNMAVGVGVGFWRSRLDRWKGRCACLAVQSSSLFNFFLFLEGLYKP